MKMTVNLKCIYTSDIFCFCIKAFNCIVNVKLCVAEMNKGFMFFINISVQVNESALLNVW